MQPPKLNQLELRNTLPETKSEFISENRPRGLEISSCQPSIVRGLHSRLFDKLVDGPYYDQSSLDPKSKPNYIP